MAIIIKSRSEITAMRRAGSVVASILEALFKEIGARVKLDTSMDIVVSEISGERNSN